MVKDYNPFDNVNDLTKSGIPSQNLNFPLARKLFFIQCLSQFYEGCGNIWEPEISNIQA